MGNVGTELTPALESVTCQNIYLFSKLTIHKICTKTFSIIFFTNLQVTSSLDFIDLFILNGL